MISHTRILTTTCTDPHKNLALEDALLQSLPDGQALLFLWQNKHTVVIGAGQNAWRECNTELLKTEGGTLARRGSGGGAVYHDLGNLNFSFIVPKRDYDVARQLKVVLQAVKSLGIDAVASGRNDLTIDERKFSGNAFRLLKTSCLHHGTIMVDVDKNLLGRYLNVDLGKLVAKGVQSVRSRVANLREFQDVSIQGVHDAMIRAFQEEYGMAEAEDAAAELPGLDDVVRHYQSWDWNYGASPAGDVTLFQRFDWGSLELSFKVLGGRLQGVQAFTDAMDETLHRRLMQALEGAPYTAAELSSRMNALNLPDVGEYLGQSVQ